MCLINVTHYIERLLVPIIQHKKITAFDSKDIPSISINNYISRWYRYGKLDKCVKIYALIILKRFIDTNDMNLTKINVHRLLSLSYITATKLYSDIFYTMTYYAGVSGIDKQELIYLEHIYLKKIDFNLYVDQKKYIMNYLILLMH